MPYSLDSQSETSYSSVAVPTNEAQPLEVTVCTRSTCDDPASVVLAVVDDVLDQEAPEVLTSRLCCTHARDAVDDLLRRAALGLDAPSLALSVIA
jgi:hypothetical protein